MKKIRHGVAAFVMMGMMIGLFVSGYEGLGSYYGIIEGGDQFSEVTNSTSNIMEQLNSLQLMQGMDSITNNVLKIGSPDATSFDILGGLASLGIGVLQTIIGVAIFPLNMAVIIGSFYIGIPATVLIGVGTIFAVYLAFIILSSYLKNEV